MHRVAAESWGDFWRPRDDQGIIAWSGGNVRPPNAARSASGFDIEATPWLREPAEFSADPETRELVLMLPTGGSKTTLFDVRIPYAIAKESGSILLALQTKPDADDHWDGRLEPILLDIESIRKSINQLPRAKRKKGEIVWPDRTLYCKPANKTTFQRKSVRIVALDEAWLIEHGLIQEARARTHNRWNRLVMIVSQGGEAQMLTGDGRRIDTELEAAWKRTDQREFSMACPQCNETHRWGLRNLKWASQEREDGSFDEEALIQSVRYVCQGCKHAFEDIPAIRRQLALESVYVASNANYRPHPHGHHRGFHAPCVAMPHESWADIALQWTMASHAWKQGDRQPRKIFIQKRKAENFREEEEVEQTALKLSEFQKCEFIDGREWPGEVCRFMTIDVQKDHFWCVVRAWKPDGSSRLLYEGKVLTWEMLRDRQTEFKVGDYFVFCDSRYKQAETEQHCAHWKWFALEGDDANEFTHYPPKQKAIKKYYSPAIRVHVVGPEGQNEVCVKFRWSNLRMKDILSTLRAGHGAEWEIPSDVSAPYKRQLVSEVKRPIIVGKDKRVVERWVKIGGRDNHLWDCEAMQVTAACVRGIIRAIVGDHDRVSSPSESAEAVN